MLTARIGIVVIGRNEELRLEQCLQSIPIEAHQTVYVDSASSDNSVKVAERLGVNTLVLNTDRPMTAARARNEGFAALVKELPELEYVQFVDGDCVLDASWLETAAAHLGKSPSAAVVCGRRRERYPEASAYNRQIDIEWDQPTGSVDSCGGDAMFRAEALSQVGGFLASRIAGEEPELCLRLRRHGYEVHRLHAPMTTHDANMHHFGEWWTRSVRNGYAVVSGAWLHRAGPERFNMRESLRIFGWAIAIPALIVFGGLVYAELRWLLALYPIQYLRLLYSQKQRQLCDALLWALFNLLGKFAELRGAITFLQERIRVSAPKLIEYK